MIMFCSIVDLVKKQGKRIVAERRGNDGTAAVSYAGRL